VEAALARLVERLSTEHPEIARVIWFGSRVRGDYAPHSDVDLCLVLSSSEVARIQDRIPVYLPDRFPCGLDIFPYTDGELDQLRRESHSWWKEIQQGRLVFERVRATG
jgi:predicted nucleotidyltransferase